MKHFFKILARRNAETSHREVKVTIDWTGVTREDLMILAKNAIVNDIHAGIRKGTGCFPAEITVIARNAVRHEPPALMEYQPKAPKVDDKLNDLLKKLSPEELKLLLATN